VKRERKERRDVIFRRPISAGDGGGQGGVKSLPPPNNGNVKKTKGTIPISQQRRNAERWVGRSSFSMRSQVVLEVKREENKNT